jgi:hypothetical protein
VLGALSVIAGVLLIRHPLGGVRPVALLIGIWLIAAGLVRFIAASAECAGERRHVFGATQGFSSNGAACVD